MLRTERTPQWDALSLHERLEIAHEQFDYWTSILRELTNEQFAAEFEDACAE